MAKQKNNFDVIIVGAGPSGLATAKLLARSNIKTLVLERASIKVSKNFYSGIINKESYESVFDDFNPPQERNLTESHYYFLEQESFSTICQNNELKNNFFIRRKELNDYLVKETIKSGVNIKHNVLVKELIVNDKKVCGVKTSSGEYFANVVVIAEGPNSLLTKTSGLRKGDYTPEEVFLFIEENITLPINKINEKFNIKENEGVVLRLLTSLLFSAKSFGYIYTLKDSVSLGLGVLLSDLISLKVNINTLLDKLKKHHSINSFISGETMNNYTSYTLPISACYGKQLPRLYIDGCLVIGGAATLIDLFELDLSGFALLSSQYAASTIIKAKEEGDYSSGLLSQYEKLVKENIIQKKMNDIKSKTKDNDDLYSLVMRSR